MIVFVAVVTCCGSAILGCRSAVVGGGVDCSAGVSGGVEAWSRGWEWLVMMGASCGGCGLWSTGVL